MSIDVLLVDDSPAMRSFIRRVIELTDVAVSSWFEASNGEEVLEVLEQHHVDLVLCDINMPRMNGEEFLRRLSMTGRAGSPPVVIVSTDATSQRIHNVMQLGAKGYVSKPFSPETMRHVLVDFVHASNSGSASSRASAEI